MEPDVCKINNDYKEKQRLKNVEEYQKKFFKNLKSYKNRGVRNVK